MGQCLQVSYEAGSGLARWPVRYEGVRCAGRGAYFQFENTPVWTWWNKIIFRFFSAVSLEERSGSAGIAEDLGESLPAEGWVFAGGPIDMGGDEVLAEAVIDDVGAVFVEEAEAAFGHGFGLEREPL